MANNKLKKVACIAIAIVMACSGLQVGPQKVQAATETENDPVQADKKATDFTVEQTDEKDIFEGNIPESMDVKVTKVSFEDGSTEECVFDSSNIVVSLEEGNTYKVGENTLNVTYMGCTKSIVINAKQDEVVSMSAEQSNPFICPGDTLSQIDFEVAASYRSGKIDSNYTDYEIVDTVVTDITKTATLRSANGIEVVVDLTLTQLEPERMTVFYNGATVKEGEQVDKNNFTVTLIYNNGKEIVLEKEAYDLVYDNIVGNKSNLVEVVYKENPDICETVYVTGVTDAVTAPPVPTATPDSTNPDKETQRPEVTPESTPESTSGNGDHTESTTEPESATSVPTTTEPASPTPDAVASATPNVPVSTTPGAVVTETPCQTATVSPNATPAGEVTTGSSVTTTSVIPSNTETPSDEVARKNSKTTVILGVGEKMKVTMSGASNVTYKTSNNKILTVTSKGSVTARKVGKAQITVTDQKGNTKTYVITVKKAPKKVKVNFTKKTMKKGKKATIKVSFTKGYYSRTNTFYSSNKKVATVNSKGVITAKKKGTCKITVKTYNGKKAVIKISVK